MNLFLIYAYLFYIGSSIGWILELFFRRFYPGPSSLKKWVNPGFCVGPYLPLYGSGLCILYFFASLGDRHGFHSFGTQALLFLIMAVSMTAIEYIAGIFCLKFYKIRLWDYSKEWANLDGLICPKFSVMWAVASAGYYFLIHPYILKALSWLSENLAFSFVIGFFFGVFAIDVCYSAQLVTKMKRFAEENKVIIRYESLKAHIRNSQEQLKEKTHFLFAFYSTRLSLLEHLKEAQEVLEERWKRK